MINKLLITSPLNFIKSKQEVLSAFLVEIKLKCGMS